jgi:hypothetical protein
VRSDTSAPAALHEVLAAAYVARTGAEAPDVFLAGKTRIHLDRVVGLGTSSSSRSSRGG